MRIAFLGGSFDPVHRGHIAMAEAALSAELVDRVVLLPAGRPPHKTAGLGATAEHRLAMIRLACEGRSRLDVDPRELHRAGPNYTVETMAAIVAESDARPFFLIGADSLADLGTWRRIEELAGLVTFLVAGRPDQADMAAPDVPGLRWVEVPMRPVEVSSSAIRRAVGDGGAWQHMVDEAVAAYMLDHRLYGAEPSGPE